MMSQLAGTREFIDAYEEKLRGATSPGQMAQ